MILSLLLALSIASAKAEVDTIKLERNPETRIEAYDFQFENLIIDEKAFNNPEKKQKIKLGTIGKQLGPINTSASFNPLSQQSQIEANLDLIDSYLFFKNNHDPRKLIPYAIKNIKESANEIKELPANIVNQEIKSSLRGVKRRSNPEKN